MKALAVWWAGQRVGRLLADDTQLTGFVYDEDWQRQGRSISCSLPLGEAGGFVAPDQRGLRFFTNLLPEGNARDRLVRRLGIADDDFRLLQRLGGDCAGALSLWPEGVTPARTGGERVLGEPELREAIRLGSGHVLAAAGEDAPRLSLAGAQDKLPVRIRASADAAPQVLLPQGDAASTHILKLPVNDLRHVPLYECYTSFIAARLELPVAEIVPLRVGEHLCSLSTRYDRIRDGSGHIERIHQEDFCQALGRARTGKYADTGAHCGLVADVIRRHADAPARDLRTLLQWQVFNALVGNTDGHLKNLSLLAGERGGWQLAPLYDLVCVLAIENVSHRLALPVGEALDPQLLVHAHWDGFAKQIGVGARAVHEAVRTLAGALHDGLKGWDADFRARYQQRDGEFEVLQRPYQVMRRQAEKALREWTPSRHV